MNPNRAGIFLIAAFVSMVAISLVIPARAQALRGRSPRSVPQSQPALAQTLKIVEDNINNAPAIDRVFCRDGGELDSHYTYFCQVLSTNKDSFTLYNEATHNRFVGSLPVDEVDIQMTTTFRLADLDPNTIQVVYQPGEKYYRLSASVVGNKRLIKVTVNNTATLRATANPVRYVATFDITLESKAAARQVASALKRAVTRCGGKTSR